MLYRLNVHWKIVLRRFVYKVTAIKQNKGVSNFEFNYPPTKPSLQFIPIIYILYSTYLWIQNGLNSGYLVTEAYWLLPIQYTFSCQAHLLLISVFILILFQLELYGCHVFDFWADLKFSLCYHDELQIKIFEIDLDFLQLFH